MKELNHSRHVRVEKWLPTLKYVFCLFNNIQYQTSSADCCYMYAYASLYAFICLLTDSLHPFSKMDHFVS